MIPAMRFFTLALALLKLTAGLHHHRQLADRHLFKHARRSTGGRSSSCSRRIGLRGNNDRGRSDRGHERSVANESNARASISVRLVVS